MSESTSTTTQDYAPLEVAGVHRVTILQAYFVEEQMKDGLDQMSLRLLGKTAANKTIEARKFMSQKRIQGGPDQGKTLAEVQIELMLKLGATAPINSANIKSLEGRPAEFDCEWDEYNNKKRLVVAWVRPVVEEITGEKADALLSLVTGGEVKTPAKSKDKPKPKAKPPAEKESAKDDSKDEPAADADTRGDEPASDDDGAVDIDF